MSVVCVLIKCTI